MTNPQPSGELLRHAERLREQTAQLQGTLSSGSPERMVRAVEQMATRARQFSERVRSGHYDPRDRDHRHDLRADLALVIGYSELWLKRAVPTGEEAAKTQSLRQILCSAREALAFLDSWTASAASGEGGLSDSVVSRENRSLEALPLRPLVGLHPLDAPPGELLVVDDNLANRDLLQALLEQQGHRVTVAASGQEALTLVAGHSFDLILLDVLMPGMDGFAVLERLKADESWKHIPVVMVSALDRLDSVVAGIAKGAEDYLTRPFEEMLLRARVGACLEKKRLRDREQDHLRTIDRLLHAIFPPEVVAELTDKGAIMPRRHEKVGVCFMDVVGFTSFCDRHADRPEEVVRMLEWYVNVFEAAARKHGVQKIKTIGDAFLMVSGLWQPVENPVLQLVHCSLEVLATIRSGPAGWQLRVGIHVGPVVAGTLGESQYSFDLWGSAVNIAARLESIGRADCITLSDTAWNDISDCYRGKPRDTAIRGIGPMTVWELDPPGRVE